MAIIYNVTVRDNRLQQVINAIDGGPANGLLSIGTAGMGITLATVVLLKPCASIAAGVLTFLGTPLTTLATNGGIAAAGQITDSTGLVVASGLTVGTAGTDIIISQTNITFNGIVSFISGSITGN